MMNTKVIMACLLLIFIVPNSYGLNFNHSFSLENNETYNFTQLINTTIELITINGHCQSCTEVSPSIYNITQVLNPGGSFLLDNTTHYIKFNCTQPQDEKKTEEDTELFIEIKKLGEGLFIKIDESERRFDFTTSDFVYSFTHKIPNLKCAGDSNITFEKCRDFAPYFIGREEYANLFTDFTSVLNGSTKMSIECNAERDSLNEQLVNTRESMGRCSEKVTAKETELGVCNGNIKTMEAKVLRSNQDEDDATTMFVGMLITGLVGWAGFIGLGIVWGVVKIKNSKGGFKQ